ncbi:hypothetical protein [Desulfurivibrio alkaliphilus]|uniref:Uncharacterized protein n=1 Tax=Desulfurivibrio alkaliphilus (strain DSM 19089 / UNIQEM U267 / AHT2) TaxID=589865 RepID=D6Z249_DESAT|nr:hypothetical protein [Desulfurivibrio alkaliphilus]ADH85624.1 conserved hypothetical protein [Desulfurivibrio alkaliphilus AHT 2]
MLLNTWSLALSLGSLLVVFMLTVAAGSAVRVLRYWNPASDDERQLSLENEIWLSSTLVAYALAIQIISLVLLVLAADDFAGVITGAMCATGTLQVNEFGLPALLVKLAGIFFYGFWLVLHRLDVSSERYPLVKIKYCYLLALLPLVVVDIALQSLYLLNIQPDVIVSCCAVVFSAGAGDGQFFLTLDGERLLPWFYGVILLLMLLGGAVVWRLRTCLQEMSRRWFPSAARRAASSESASADTQVTVTGCGLLLPLVYGLIWLFFLPLALLVITTVLSSYIYAMPFHNCPFCILKPEYAYVGFAIYLTLLAAAFFALSVPLAGLLAGRFAAAGHGERKESEGEDFTVEEAAEDLRREGMIAPRFQYLALRLSLLLLLLFVLFSSFHFVRYLLMGGEV